MAIARLFLIALIGSLMYSAPAFSQALLLFDNGHAYFTGGFEMTAWTVADDFEVSFSSQATRGTFSLRDATCTFPANWDGNLRWWIYADAGGLPGGHVASGFAPDVSATLGFDNCPDAAWYSVQFTLGQMVPLSSGVRYWLALHMAADWSVSSDLSWGVTKIGNFSPGVSSYLGTGPWGTVGLEHSFTVEFVSDDEYLFVDGFESGDTTIWSLTVP